MNWTVTLQAIARIFLCYLTVWDFCFSIFCFLTAWTFSLSLPLLLSYKMNFQYTLIGQTSHLLNIPMMASDSSQIQNAEKNWKFSIYTKQETLQESLPVDFHQLLWPEWLSSLSTSWFCSTSYAMPSAKKVKRHRVFLLTLSYLLWTAKWQERNPQGKRQTET